jgi:hypothetical protein
VRRDWLGGRDSNPDTQIQSPSESEANQQDQRLNLAKRGQLRQNPQCSRNGDYPRLQQGENENVNNPATPTEMGAASRRFAALTYFDFEEDTLP